MVIEAVFLSLTKMVGLYRTAIFLRIDLKSGLYLILNLFLLIPFSNVAVFTKSSPIELTHGKKYYLEMECIEYGGADYFAVAMELPDQTIVYPITSNYLGRYD